MGIERIDFSKTQAKTIRLQRNGRGYNFLGISPNCGLESYLCEALLRTGRYNHSIKTEIENSLERLLNEAQIYRDHHFWGWEKKPSIESVYLPLDWDDTSKAIDFILLAQKLDPSVNKNIIIPNSLLWQKEIENSLFESATIGEDIVIDCSHKLALSVFFGSLSPYWPLRDDPMVTVTTIRTTALWYPEVVKNLYDQIIVLLNRQIFVLNCILETSTPFSKLSRYYFSAGHFTYRLIETLNCLKFTPLELIHPNLINKVNKANNDLYENIKYNKRIDSEIIWWYLIGINLDIIENKNIDFKKVIQTNGIKDEIVFRHRRFNHYYYAENWLNRLQLWEFERSGLLSKIQNETYEEVCTYSNYRIGKYQKAI